MNREPPEQQPPKKPPASSEVDSHPAKLNEANRLEPGSSVESEVLSPDTDTDSESTQLIFEEVERTLTLSGPIPPPRVLAEYGQIQPDLVDRIVKMAEKQQAHRHRMEERSLSASITLSIRGLMTGFLVGLAGLGAATWMVHEKQSAAGIIIGSVDLIGLVSVFVLGNRRRAKKAEPREENLSGDDTESKSG